MHVVPEFPATSPQGEGSMAQHSFERYDECFACPNCENPLPHDEFPQTCLECGFTIEVFLSREDGFPPDLHSTERRN